MRNGALTIDDFEQRAQGDGAIIHLGRVPVFSFRSRCHPEAALRAEYSSGDVTLACAGCGAVLCRVAVADR